MLADKYIKLYIQGAIDRLDVAFTPSSLSASRQLAMVQTLLPISTAELGKAGPSVRQAKRPRRRRQPDAEDRVVPLRVFARPAEHS